MDLFPYQNLTLISPESCFHGTKCSYQTEKFSRNERGDLETKKWLYN